MEMMNRAIEDASDFSDMMKKLTEKRDDVVRRNEALTVEREVQAASPPPKRPGENRAQYRARMYGKAAA